MSQSNWVIIGSDAGLGYKYQLTGLVSVQFKFNQFFLQSSRFKSSKMQIKKILLVTFVVMALLSVAVSACGDDYDDDYDDGAGVNGSRNAARRNGFGRRRRNGSRRYRRF